MFGKISLLVLLLASGYAAQAAPALSQALKDGQAGKFKDAYTLYLAEATDDKADNAMQQLAKNALGHLLHAHPETKEFIAAVDQAELGSAEHWWRAAIPPEDVNNVDKLITAASMAKFSYVPQAVYLYSLAWQLNPNKSRTALDLGELYLLIKRPADLIQARHWLETAQTIYDGDDLIQSQMPFYVNLLAQAEKTAGMTASPAAKQKMADDIELD